MWQPYPNYRMNPDLRSPIFPQAFALLSVSHAKILIGAPTRWQLVQTAAVHERPNTVSIIFDGDGHI